MKRHRSPPSQRRLLAGLLTCALLLSQALGLLHRMVHTHGARLESSALTAPAPALATLKAMFAAHQDRADCQIFDQLSHADAVGVARVDILGATPAAAPARISPRPTNVGPAAGYLARGPPGLA